MFTKIMNTLLSERKVSAYAVSKATGISNGNLSEYKSGAKSPTIDNLSKLADYFGVSVDYLIGRAPSQTNTITGDVTGGAIVQGVNNSGNIIQGVNNGTVSVSNQRPLSEEETELLRIYADLDLKRKNKLLSLAFTLEDETKGN